MSNNSKLTWLIVLLSCIGYYFVSYEIERSDFEIFIALYGALFAGYLFLSFKPVYDFKSLIVVAIVFRVIHLFALPHLSDDFYRFLWDGLCTVNGFHPFDYTPNQMAELGLMNYPELLSSMNSPDYYSVYPPINQLLFYVSALFYDYGIEISVLVLRFFVLLAELGTLLILSRLLAKLNLGRSNLALYAFNPLVILEFTHSLHFEVFMVFFVVATLWLLSNKKWVLGAFAFACAVCVKIIPLMFLPLLLKSVKLKNFVLFSMIAGLVSLLLFTPLYNDVFIPHFRESLNLYFKTFEFNSSIAHFANWATNNVWWVEGWYFLVIELGLMALVFFTVQTQKLKGQAIAMSLVLLLYLLFTRSLHPWYMVSLLAFVPLTNFKFPLVWSFLIAGTYITYQTNDYQQNYWVIVIEYIVVFVAVIVDLRAMDKKYWESIRNFVRNGLALNE